MKDAEMKLGYLACMNDKNITYSEFCRSLAKSGEVMDKEISEKEEKIILQILELSKSIVEQTYYTYNIDIPRDQDLMIQHMVVGMVGEIGEILDIVKNIIIYRKDVTSINKEGKRLDNNFVEEIGDLLFFWTEYCQLVKDNNLTEELNEDAMNDYFNEIIATWNEIHGDAIRPVTLKMCIEQNVIKLSQRYHKGSYSDKQATERNDKK